MKVGITSTGTESPELHRTGSGESSDPTMAFLAALGALVPGLVASPAVVTGTAAAKTATGTSGIGKVETGKSGPTTGSTIPNSAKLTAVELEGLAVAVPSGAAEVGSKNVTATKSAVMGSATSPTSTAPISAAPASAATASIANLLNAVAAGDGAGAKNPAEHVQSKSTAAQIANDNVPLPTTAALPTRVSLSLASSLPPKPTGKESEATSPGALKPEPALPTVAQAGPATVAAGVVGAPSPLPNTGSNIASKVVPKIGAKDSSAATTVAPDGVGIATSESTAPVVTSAPAPAAGQSRTVMSADTAGANSTLSSGGSAAFQAADATAGRASDHGHDKPTENFKGKTGEQVTSVPANLAVPPTPSRAEFAAAITTQTQVARPQIADQLAPYVTALRHQPDGTHQITVVLHPAELGQVQVMVELRNGTVQLQLSGAHEAARAVLNDSLPQLRRELTDAGLTVGSADVMTQDFGTGTGSAAGGNPGQNYQPGASARDVPRDVGGLLRTPVVGPFASPVRGVVHAGVLDVNI